MSSSKGSTPRSSSRSKRSTTNLANLRLAPLSAKFADDTPDSGSLDGQTDAFTKLSASHRSAPTSPRILSRSSSRKYLGGLSRRSSLYENDGEGGRGYRHGYGYGRGIEDETRVTGTRLEVASGQVPKAKSEAALGVPLHRQQRLSGPGVQLKRQCDAYHPPRNRTSGSTTPRVRIEDDWLTRTGQAASSILQEQKGQSFIASRNSQSALALDTQDLTDDDEDEGYEEMAALSARSTTRSGFADDELSPVSTRASRWGSRYGSRRTSRRGSTVGFSGSRTPLASAQPQNADGRASYFDPNTLDLPIEPDFVDEEDGSSADEAGITASTFTSLGGLVDKLIGFNLFNVEEGRETGTESEGDGDEGETETEAKRRIEAEVRRRREEKERLRDAQQARWTEGGDGEGGWQEDARWLFGRAREAWM